MKKYSKPDMYVFLVSREEVMVGVLGSVVSPSIPGGDINDLSVSGGNTGNGDDAIDVTF